FMNASNGNTAPAPAAALKRCRNAGDGAWLLDDPIYKAKQMHTVAPMLKRILPVLVGACLGLVLAGVVLRQAAVWGFLPNRELNRSADYVRDVMRLVNNHYVQVDEVAY